jgi:membrane associated rhomboid family serine protease
MNYYTQVSSKEISRSIRAAVVVPAFTLLVMGLVKFLEVFGHKNFVSFGVIPRDVKGLIGIVTGPLVHGDWEHLMNNSISLFLFGTALFFFYRKFAIKIWLLIYFISSALVWVFARGGVSHVGISGVIYGLGFFLFFSGMLRKNKRLAAISLMLTFFYGSMVWGVLPGDPRISWEAHLMGAVLGVFLAVYYRNTPSGIEHFDEEKRPEIPDIIGDEWKMEEPETIDFGMSQPKEPFFQKPEEEPLQAPPRITYTYVFKPSKGSNEE